jgi:hypothetical protein
MLKVALSSRAGEVCLEGDALASTLLGYCYNLQSQMLSGKPYFEQERPKFLK